MSLRATVGLTLAFACGCGMVTERRATVRDEQRREPYVRPARRVFTASERIEGDVLHVEARVDQRCQRGHVAYGVDRTAVIRTFSDTQGMVTIGGVAGLAGVGGGTWLLVRADSADDPETARTVAAASMAIGAALTLPWIIRHLQARDGVEIAPYRDEVAYGESTCRTVAANGMSVRLQVGAADAFEGHLGVDGALDLDLAARVDERVWRDAASTEGRLYVGAEVVRSLDLRAVRSRWIDRRWGRALADPDALADFAREFPDDPRSRDVPRRIREAQRRRLFASRRQEWASLTDDPVGLQGFIEQTPWDAFAVEVVCRLGLQAHGASALAEAATRCEVAMHELSEPARLEATDAVLRAHEHHRAVARLRDEAAVIEAAEAARAEARASAAREREHARRRSVVRAAQSRVEASLAACRGGRTGAASARAAYEALRGLLEVDPARTRSLTLRVASACRCTPSCAGVGGL